MSAPQYYEQQAPTDGSRGYPPNGYNNFNTNNRYPAYNSSGQYSAACPADIHSPIILYTFLIGLFESQTIASAIDAGVSIIFVGLDEDPMVLAERSPGLFEHIRQAYPEVVHGVPHNT